MLELVIVIHKLWLGLRALRVLLYYYNFVREHWEVGTWERAGVLISLARNLAISQFLKQLI